MAQGVGTGQRSESGDGAVGLLSLLLRDAGTGELVRRLGDAQPTVGAVVVSQDGELAVSVDATDTIRLWDIQSDQV